MGCPMVIRQTIFILAIFVTLKKQGKGEICVSSDSPSDWQPALRHKLTVRMIQPMDGLGWERSVKNFAATGRFRLIAVLRSGNMPG